MNPPFELSPWQKKQATLLYHFASLDYLKGLQKRVYDLIAFIDPTLDLAKMQQRDALLKDPRWGMRNTAENWANNAWPFLEDFRLDIAKDIANRAFEIYGETGAYQCWRGMSEYSMQWTTPDEQDKFDAMFREISSYARHIDRTMKRQNGWNDGIFTGIWSEFKDQFPRLPKFRVRADVQGETDKKPPRTGVYVPMDDPYGALQFAWAGNAYGELYACRTFNDDGIRVLNLAGRDAIWTDRKKMYEIATSQYFKNRVEKELKSLKKPPYSQELVGSALSNLVYTDRPCKWYYVEMLNDEFEDIPEESAATPPPQNRLRVEGGQPCPQAGYWLTPAKAGSRRHFKKDETMPVLSSDYGSTIWQWDANQSA